MPNLNGGFLCVLACMFCTPAPAMAEGITLQLEGYYNYMLRYEEKCESTGIVYKCATGTENAWFGNGDALNGVGTMACVHLEFDRSITQNDATYLLNCRNVIETSSPTLGCKPANCDEEDEEPEYTQCSAEYYFHATEDGAECLPCPTGTAASGLPFHTNTECDYCTLGYYAQDGKCVRCPGINGISGSTTTRNLKTNAPITKCYMPATSGPKYADESGRFHFVARCDYVQQ